MRFFFLRILHCQVEHDQAEHQHTGAAGQVQIQLMFRLGRFDHQGRYLRLHQAEYRQHRADDREQESDWFAYVQHYVLPENEVEDYCANEDDGAENDRLFVPRQR